MVCLLRAAHDGQQFRLNADWGGKTDMYKTLMQTLEDAGYPRNEFDHHGSDLYVFACINGVETRPIIDKWFAQNGLSVAVFVEPFVDNVTGKLMYDCAFQYIPYWERAVME